MTNQHIDDVRLFPSTTEKLLNERQCVDYRDHCEQLIKWLVHIGKNPETADGYSSSTIEKDAYRLDKSNPNPAFDDHLR